MNSEEGLRIHNLMGREIKELEYQSILSGVKGTMIIFKQVMKEEFGYGDLRLKRIENAVKKKMGMEE